MPRVQGFGDQRNAHTGFDKGHDARPMADLVLHVGHEAMRCADGHDGVEIVWRRVARETNEFVVLQSLEVQRSRFLSRILHQATGDESLEMEPESSRLGGGLRT